MNELVAAVALAFAQPEGYVEAGRCHFALTRNGTFYQEDQYTKNKLNVACLGVGFMAKIRNADRLGIRIGLLASASWENRSNTATFYDDEIGKTGLSCDMTNSAIEKGRGCYTVHNGSGDLRGLSLGVTYQIFPAVYAEGGGLFYRLKHYNHVSWAGNGPAWGQPGDYFTSSRTEVLSAKPTIYAGLMFRYKSAYVFARRYESLGGHPDALTNGSFKQIGVGYAF